MADPASGRSARFDRVAPPDPSRPRPRDAAGKEALYSTAPSATPSSQVLIHCARCDVQAGLSMLRTIRTLRPPFLWVPGTNRLWGRCPTCDRRSWLTIRKGQALRALLDRVPTGR